MPGTLYVVATPIGNLEDVTLRALRILREVSLIAAEDTRRTARLLQHYSISTPTTSLHKHNEGLRAPALLARLAAGESVALVSDAGTPVVSDPGTELVAAAHAAGIKVEPVPGPSALLAALSASGIPADQFVFVGFPPVKGNARISWFRALAEETRTSILYEAPHRIRQTLSALLTVLGDRPVAVARELTKAHEELVIRPISRHISAFEVARGEFTIIVPPPEPSSIVGQKPYSNETLRAEFEDLVGSGSSPRAAVRTLAKKYSIPSRGVYSVVHQTGIESG
jgi:16S rRNA (cytidine1402-2'-O)-methyltransferase